MLLQVQFILNALVEVNCTLVKRFVAILLCDSLPLGPFRSLIQEVKQEVFDLGRKIVKAYIVLVSKFMRDGLVVLLQEHQAGLFRGLFIFFSEEVQLLVHPLLQSLEELFPHISNGHFVESLHRQLF